MTVNTNNKYRGCVQCKVYIALCPWRNPELPITPDTVPCKYGYHAERCPDYEYDPNAKKEIVKELVTAVLEKTDNISGKPGRRKWTPEQHEKDRLRRQAKKDKEARSKAAKERWNSLPQEVKDARIAKLKENNNAKKTQGTAAEPTNS